MIHKPVYMDNHATTRVDPRVVEAMLPYFSEAYGNAGSTNHPQGWAAKEAVDAARKSIARSIGARPKEIVFTSGATESNNLAIFGAVHRNSDRGRHIVSVVTEHRAVRDPLERLRLRDYEITLLPVIEAPHEQAGLVPVERVADAIRDDTVLVSVMLANNEIGAIQPVDQIGRICHRRGVLLHTDAVQAVGKIPVDVGQLAVDLMSFSAHKIYGPKGVGALYVRRSNPVVRIEPQIYGGGQEGSLRSGTLNVPAIVGFARALELCLEEMPDEAERLRRLRDRLYQGLTETLCGVTLNGPALAQADLRLSGSLNVSFAQVEGEALLMSAHDLAVSTGSACTSASPEPSHVLRALGLNDETTRSSVRFGLGRFNTTEEIDFAVDLIAQTVTRLRKMG
ncbi:MAG: aminotransferase class V-fold PLP-dependent enzyme [Candidatus Nealsonbacteria bacterium]|nr:aminotransferase class V-fold PLP-dependent enzyme [Candidatus Nealsonbacteria bacterium]